jgi:REP element-mobilizing transposase RayT
MARPLRITYPGAFYHITSRGNEKKDIFTNERDKEKFIEYLESATQRYSAVIHIYCLMNNHYHLLLETPIGNLPQIMRHINGAYTNYFNTKWKRSGHLFQGRYKAILVDVDEYAKVLSRYIHLNPVRAEMVQTPEEYNWSCYQYYIGKKKPPEWIRTDFILGYFGSRRSAAQRGYQRYVNQLVNSEYENPLNEVVGSCLLGSQGFIEHIKDTYISSILSNKEIPAINELTDKLSIQDIVNTVEAIFTKHTELKRNVKIHLCRRHTSEKLKTIGAYFGIGESAVCQASRRLLKLMNEDKGLQKTITKVERKLTTR